MSAAGVHARVTAVLDQLALPYTVGQTATVGPVVVVGLPALITSPPGLCDPPIGTYTVDLTAIPASPGAIEELLTWVDQLHTALSAEGTVTGSPVAVGYLDQTVEAYTVTVEIED
jgi:hypothetical protein